MDFRFSKGKPERSIPEKVLTNKYCSYESGRFGVKHFLYKSINVLRIIYFPALTKLIVCRLTLHSIYNTMSISNLII